MKFIDNIHQQKEHRPQAHNGKDVREKYNVRILGYRKYGGSRNDREKKIGKFNNEQHQEKRRDHFFLIDLYKKFIPHKLRMNRKIFGGQFYYFMIFGIYFI